MLGIVFCLLPTGWRGVRKRNIMAEEVIKSLFSVNLCWHSSFSWLSFFIKEFRIMGLSINDSVYSSVFFFLTGLHFFHLVIGLLLVSLLPWNCSFYFLSFSIIETGRRIWNPRIINGKGRRSWKERDKRQRSWTVNNHW